MVERISATVPAYCTGAPFISTSVADSIRRHSPPFASPMPALPTAATSAACSGDIVGLYAADSTERPVCTMPSLSTSAKPAGESLYGAYAAFASASASAAAAPVTAENRLKRDTAFLCHMQFKNDLPAVPIDWSIAAKAGLRPLPPGGGELWRADNSLAGLPFPVLLSSSEQRFFLTL